MKKQVIIGMLLLLVACKATNPSHTTGSDISSAQKPTISFTFDDGNTADMPGYTLEVWNTLLLKSLQKHNLKAILFSSGANKTDQKGKYVLQSWNDAGHRIANHTFTHPNFNSNKTTLENFEWELMMNDSIIKTYSNYLPLFRFPYLKEGNTAEKVNGFRLFMKEKGYRNGYVTIDASDWYVDSRLRERLKQNTKANVEAFKTFYIEHLYDRAQYYESLSYQLTNRHINHTILLHHNLAAALFLDDLIQYFKDKGWNVMDAEKAYADAIYQKQPTNIPAGESLIWALAKESGKFESTLRYPAEDSEYEKDKMDKLGL
ncbi:polysaccharide deacetylase family protein [Cytophagaceae bacterium YF14B1]|uniref:Polysaccharide deacetylase family protein n=1 Tax=Xanthocytophaga flava TaxID=3048013 RepID=A0AAE3QW56_9BACT|nr:polysaccharide deacetylase family protein [Xanthocytophaga flavus]MDJ1483623.1 polysaccharide deacetylase family protein [Xanthocytophaga flavus]